VSLVTGTREPRHGTADLEGLSPASVVVAAGRPRRIPGAPVNPPVELSATYAAPPAGTAYGRNGNATWMALEEAVGALEHGNALVFASGMAAIAAAMAFVPPGGTVVAPRTAYNITTALLADYADEGHAVRHVEIADTDAVVTALDGADLLWLESPTNPTLEVADLPALVAAAHARDVLTVCDNTFATPLLQRPLDLGADVVVHSATKYLSGHSDVLLGVAVTKREDLYVALQRRRLVYGGIAGPMEAWLALRGLRTLHVRFERQCANAAEIARRATEHPAVERVRYPGFGAMVSIEVRGGAAAADHIAAACRLWLDATSLGGVESLIERRRKYAAESPTVPENLLRMSVGIEDVDDLWRDLASALDTVNRGPREVSDRSGELRGVN
jgi:cystathionine gamma-synthase